MITTIGILGAGKVGTVLARLALAAGYRVLISASGPVAKIALIVDVLAPGAIAVTGSEAAEADLVILAAPLGKYRALPPITRTDAIVVDAMNFWWPVDGHLDEFEQATRSSSEIVHDVITTPHFVKAFSHMGYHDLDERGRPAGSADRLALALAGDDREAVAAVAGVIDALGFDPVDAGALANGIRFQPGTELFGATVGKAEVEAMLERASA